MKPWLLPCLWLLPLLLRAQAPPPVPDSAQARLAAAWPALDKLYAAYAAKRQITGLAYGVVVNGQLGHTGAVGLADRTAKIPATAQTVFRIASLTKSFVALAVLHLRDQGRLRLDDPITRYLPPLKLTPTDGPPPTIRQLLSHTAGLPEDNPWGDRQLAQPDAALDARLRRGLPLAHPPGTAYQYSNLGYALLGRLVRQVSGQPVQAYITANLLRPLGMSHTYWDFRRVPPARLAAGYGAQGQPEKPLPDAGGSWAALGGLLTTVEDFGRYLAFLSAAEPAQPGAPDPGPVRRSSVRELLQPGAFNSLGSRPGEAGCALVNAYGYGVRVAHDCRGRRYVGHGGGLPGFGCHWWLLPAYGVAVVVLTNQTYAVPTAVNYAALDTLLARTDRRPYPIRPAPILRQRYAELTRLLPAWERPDPATFAENFFLDQDLATRRRETAALLAQIGPLVATGPLRPDDALRGRFTLRGERGSIEVFFTLSPETPARVQELTLTVGK